MAVVGAYEQTQLLSAPSGGEVRWDEFLPVLAEALAGRHGSLELRGMFRGVGQRLAETATFGAPTLAALEAQINEWLAARGWGWLRIDEQDAWLDLIHGCGPLRAGFGAATLQWSAGLLEGLYAGWLQQAGCGTELQLRQLGGIEGDLDLLRFRLAHPSVLEASSHG